MKRVPGLDTDSGGALSRGLSRRERELAALGAIARPPALLRTHWRYSLGSPGIFRLYCHGPIAAAMLGEDHITIAPLRPAAEPLRQPRDAMPAPRSRSRSGTSGRARRRASGAASRPRGR
jgi:hypothetical protein